MVKDTFKSLFTVLIVLVLGAMAGVRLMKIQVVGGESPDDLTVEGAFTFTRDVTPTRGEIIDYRGNLIVANDTRCDIVLQKAFFPEDFQKGNDIILKACNMLSERGYEFKESLPVTSEYPYQFISNERGSLEDNIAEVTKLLNLNSYATADNCIDKLISDYEISKDYTPEEKRIVAGVRYEMIVGEFSYQNDLTLAEDVDTDTIALMKEMGNVLRGVEAVDRADRNIVRGDILPHEIGTVGPIYAEEYEKLREKGYALNDVVGKSGIESAMEKELRGKSGQEKITVLGDSIVDVETTDEITAGQTVKLTVDGAFQIKLQEILDNFLSEYDQGGLAKKGAVVVLDAKTGAVRGMVNAPTYNLKDYTENYEALRDAENFPLFDRCTYGQYLPGSTFKTITATAGLNEGVALGDTAYTCNKYYTFYGYPFECTGYHGAISVRRALEVSCNVYFYELGAKLGIDTITKYAQLYGLGESTGIETGDADGFLCTPEAYAQRGEEWHIGYVIQAAIGNQGCGFTPLQLATVAGTIANRGIRYKPYLVDSLYTYGSNELTKQTKPAVAGQIRLNYDYVYDYIINGMIDASHNMPSEYSLSDLGYSVAIKTGTPQTDLNDKSKQNSLFIGFAPVDNPEVAFAGVVEGGDYSKYMIRDILLAYQECYGLNGTGRKTGGLPAEKRTTATVSTTTAEQETTTTTAAD